MKTKIIYISGNEVFDMADIRAAFDTVRNALSLDRDTVLFGVPVDSDDAFATDKTPDIHLKNAAESVTIDESEQETKTNNISKSDDPVNTEALIDAIPEKPKKVARNTRAKVIPITTVDPVVEPNDNNTKESTDAKSAVPILSVLGGKSEKDSIIGSTEPGLIAEPIDESRTDPVTAMNDINGEQPETQSVTIGDMLADDTTPVDAHEKTLEELLESMTPLGEDEKATIPPVTNSGQTTDTDHIVQKEDDTDATLELLATEFAESADKIVTSSKTETRGKIGKLKNILPFKKAKRDDSGIMGDLFGWAGVANDEDFTIPGFFANASSKK